MTEKRYEIQETTKHDFIDTITGKGYCYGEGIDLLNKLNNENKNLSKLNKILEGFLLDNGYDFKDIIKFVQERTDKKGDKT